MFSVCRQWRTYTKARRSLSSLAHNTQREPSRLIHLQGLPTGYDKNDILKGVYSFVEQVTFQEKAAEIHFFSRAHRLYFREPSDPAKSVDMKVDNISAGLVAQIGTWGVNRCMEFYFMSDMYTPDMIDDVEANVRSFGPLGFNYHGVQVAPFTTAKGLHGFNVSFLSLADAMRCYKFYRSRREPTKVFATFRKVFDPYRQLQPRTVTISNLSRELVTSRVLFENLESFGNSSSPPLGEMIFHIIRSPDTGTVTVTFSSPNLANHFLETFPATLLGAQAKLVPSPKPMNSIIKIALQSGAGRRVALFIDHLSPDELGRDFAWCGDHDVHIYSDRAVLEFHHIKSALKAVAYMTTGHHMLPEKYTGALVSFEVENSIQEMQPVPIAQGMLSIDTEDRAAE